MASLLPLKVSAPKHASIISMLGSPGTSPCVVYVTSLENRYAKGVGGVIVPRNNFLDTIMVRQRSISPSRNMGVGKENKDYGSGSTAPS